LCRFKLHTLMRPACWASGFWFIFSLPFAFAGAHTVNEQHAAAVRNYGHIRVSETPESVVVDSGPMQIAISLTSGLATYSWSTGCRISEVYSGARLGAYFKSTDYSAHRFVASDTRRLRDGFGLGLRLSFLHTQEGKPALRQTYYLYEGKPFFLLEIALESPTVISTNWLAPLQVGKPGTVSIGESKDERVLIVPWDNDNFVRYRGAPIDSAGSSYEVTSIYDNTSRKGLVIGSISHDAWKSAIDYRGTSGKLEALTVYAGASSSVTQDTVPHGTVSGTAVVSPRFLVGFYEDWRAGMEEYGWANSVISPPLPWAGEMPVGWNSWYAYGCDINSEAMVSTSDFIRNNLQGRGYGNNGVVYVNWDSFCGAGPQPDYQKVAEHIKQNGQRPGIYFVPFARFGKGGDEGKVPGTNGQYTWNDLLLRDANHVPIPAHVGRPLDPTHPGTRMYVESTLRQFKQWGYEFVKLDFLSHGAMEGKHYLSSFTAMQAYNYGMRYVRGAVAGRMFVSLSIAPLFPGTEYANSRRISCDAAGSIKEIEYMLNSVTYGWWLGKYYRYNDGDLVVVGRNTPNEAVSRVTASAITGVFLDSDAFPGTPSVETRAHDLLTRPAILALARKGKTFRPVENNTGDRATDEFVCLKGTTLYLAVFNYQQEPVTKSIDLSRAGLSPRLRYHVTDLWNGASQSVLGSMSVHLDGAQAAIFSFTPVE
jgi:hypothetical protein